MIICPNRLQIIGNIKYSVRKINVRVFDCWIRILRLRLAMDSARIPIPTETAAAVFAMFGRRMAAATTASNALIENKN